MDGSPPVGCSGDTPVGGMWTEVPQWSAGAKPRYGVWGRKSSRSWSSLQTLFTDFDCRNNQNLTISHNYNSPADCWPVCLTVGRTKWPVAPQAWHGHWLCTLLLSMYWRHCVASVDSTSAVGYCLINTSSLVQQVGLSLKNNRTHLRIFAGFCILLVMFDVRSCKDVSEIMRVIRDVWLHLEVAIKAED